MVVIQMTEDRLREHLQHAAQLGAHIAMRDAGLPVREYFTRRELQQRHGRGRVDQLIRDGLLTPHQYPSPDGKKTRTVYSEEQLLTNII